MPVADAAAAKQTFGSRELSTGMQGRDVRVLQDFLTRAGLATPVDGRYGPGTAHKVRSWERRSELKVDGRISRRDAKVLRGAVESSAPAAPVAAPAGKATVGPDGLATAPASAPPQVKAIIAAGNEIATKPYRYGGGHGDDFEDSGYDCSGSMSYALRGTGLKRPLDSTGFMRFGDAGKGQWVTTYAHGGHSFMVVAGLRFDTSGRKDAGTRWQAKMRSSSGYIARHPKGL